LWIAIEGFIQYTYQIGEGSGDTTSYDSDMGEDIPIEADIYDGDFEGDFTDSDY
jgi:hypothetical protein